MIGQLMMSGTVEKVLTLDSYNQGSTCLCKIKELVNHILIHHDEAQQSFLFLGSKGCASKNGKLFGSRQE